MFIDFITSLRVKRSINKVNIDDNFFFKWGHVLFPIASSGVRPVETSQFDPGIKSQKDRLRLRVRFAVLNTLIGLENGLSGKRTGRQKRKAATGRGVSLTKGSLFAVL